VAFGAYGRQEWCIKMVRLEGKRPLGRLRHRWEYNSKMVLVMDLLIWLRFGAVGGHL
jgi:hypothetical protein